MNFLISDLPKSALVVLDHITAEGPLAPRDISNKFNLPLRTPNLMDMRKPQYRTNNERVRELHEVIDLLRAQMNIQFRAI